MTAKARQPGVWCSDWPARLEAVKVAQHLVEGLKKLIAPHVPVLTQHCWKLFVDAYPVFEAVVLNDEDVESDGIEDAAGVLESIVEQVCDPVLLF